MEHFIMRYFGQAYSDGAYGAGCYSQGDTSGSVCGANTTVPGGSGGLADTGIALIAIVTLACVLIFAALIVRIWRRKTVPVPQKVNSKRQPQDSKL